MAEEFTYTSIVEIKKAAVNATAVPQFADKRKACYSKLLQCECEQTLVQQGATGFVTL